MKKMTALLAPALVTLSFVALSTVATTPATAKARDVANGWVIDDEDGKCSTSVVGDNDTIFFIAATTFEQLGGLWMLGGVNPAEVANEQEVELDLYLNGQGPLTLPAMGIKDDKLAGYIISMPSAMVFQTFPNGFVIEARRGDKILYRVDATGAAPAIEALTACAKKLPVSAK